jgi:tetratricopeptide (TPR) repeat protein
LSALGEDDKAIADYSEVIRRDSKDAKAMHALAYHALGWAYTKKGQQGEAEADFAEAKRLGFNGKPEPPSP